MDRRITRKAVEVMIKQVYGNTPTQLTRITNMHGQRVWKLDVAGRYGAHLECKTLALVAQHMEYRLEEAK